MDIRTWYKKHKQFFSTGNVKSVRKLKPVIHSINERQNLKESLANKSAEGEIGIIWEGMDCDCVTFSYGSVVKASLIELYNYIQKNFEDAEGPLDFNFVSPKEAKEYKRTSRDLALEAFEDGHSHIVYY